MLNSAIVVMKRGKVAAFLILYLPFSLPSCLFWSSCCHSFAARKNVCVCPRSSISLSLSILSFSVLSPPLLCRTREKRGRPLGGGAFFTSGKGGRFFYTERNCQTFRIVKEIGWKIKIRTCLLSIVWGRRFIFFPSVLGDGDHTPLNTTPEYKVGDMRVAYKLLPRSGGRASLSLPSHPPTPALPMYACCPGGTTFYLFLSLSLSLQGINFCRRKVCENDRREWNFF